MRRRVAFAVVASVATALVLVGMGTLLLSRGAARRSAEADLRRQASVVAELVASLGTASQPDAAGNARLSPASLRKVSDAFNLEDLGVLIIGPRGREYGSLPDKVALSEQEASAVRSGGEVSGPAARGRVYAAAGRPVGDSVVIVGVTGSTRGLLAGSTGWFVLSSLFVIVLAVALALWIGSRLARPVREATEVTRRIAGGDLAARLPAPPPGADDETAVLARSVNIMADALARSRGMEQQFLMSVSHDLRTPLTNIRGYAEAIVDEATPPAAGAEVILRESARLERLVRDLLELARLDARQFRLHPVPTDLGAVVTDAAESHRAELTGAGLALEVHRGAPLRGTTDPDRLAQIVGNLLSNATRFAATTVTVVVGLDAANGAMPWGVADGHGVIDSGPSHHGFHGSLRPGSGDPSSGGSGGSGGPVSHASQVSQASLGSDHHVVVQVRNDGASIAPADLPFVFDRLYQGEDQPTRTESHSGLGLAIVRELVSAMGGDVGVLTPPEGGTLFWFRVPLG